MASALKNLSEYDEKNLASAEKMTFGIVVSDWNPKITHALYEGAYDTLIKHGAKSEKIHTLQVPGAFELPMGAKLSIKRDKPDVVICIGCVIKGETAHNEYINRSVSSALMQLSLMTDIPCIFGLLTPNDEQQAKDRAGGKHGNKGVEAAVTAIRMVALEEEISQQKGKIGY